VLCVIGGIGQQRHGAVGRLPDHQRQAAFASERLCERERGEEKERCNEKKIANGWTAHDVTFIAISDPMMPAFCDRRRATVCALAHQTRRLIEMKQQCCRPGEAEMACEQCGKPMTGGRLRRYCKPSCRQAAYRERQHDK
jgi:hypothetical protein